MSDEYDILIELSADDVSKAANEKDKRDAEIERLRAENERLREANEHGRGLYYKLDEERQKVIVQVARLRSVLKIFADDKTYITDSHIRAAKAALGKTDD